MAINLSKRYIKSIQFPGMDEPYYFPEQKEERMTNCPNCGAPIAGSACQYCGTRFSGNGIQASFGRNDWKGTLDIGGNIYQVYLSQIETSYAGTESWRDESGRLCSNIGRSIRKFTLMEV